MGKRSNFERRERDYYPTPAEAVAPLLPHLPAGAGFIEPCAGDGALVRHLEGAGLTVMRAFDISPQASWIGQGDALTETIASWEADMIVTNPPWDRVILHQMIERFSRVLPTWLLFDADWVHTRQATPFLSSLHKIVSVGRVKWIPGSKTTGKDNCAWHLFDARRASVTEFVGRTA